MLYLEAFLSRRRPRIARNLTQLRPSRLLTSREGTGQPKLRGDTVNAMSRIQILDDNHLIAGGHAFAGGNDRPGEEQLPDLSDIRTHVCSIVDHDHSP